MLMKLRWMVQNIMVFRNLRAVFDCLREEPFEIRFPKGYRRPDEPELLASIERDPDDAMAHGHLAAIRLGNGLYEEARQGFMRAIELSSMRMTKEQDLRMISMRAFYRRMLAVTLDEMHLKSDADAQWHAAIEDWRECTPAKYLQQNSYYKEAISRLEQGIP